MLLPYKFCVCLIDLEVSCTCLYCIVVQSQSFYSEKQIGCKLCCFAQVLIDAWRSWRHVVLFGATLRMVYCENDPISFLFLFCRKLCLIMSKTSVASGKRFPSHKPHIMAIYEMIWNQKCMNQNVRYHRKPRVVRPLLFDLDKECHPNFQEKIIYDSRKANMRQCQRRHG